jgi:D-alanyl-lipoteichoic acid acyltransferase DltB (MBOAT superfamily)
MLFNSYEFAFGFLPLALLVFYLLGRTSRTWALGWLIVASLAFYAWWRPFNLALIAPSIIVNYVVARGLLAWRRDPQRRVHVSALLVCGILFNVMFLGYFKYTDFLIGASNDIFGTHFALRHIVLPLAISFITFQKIAFLVDVHAGRVESFSLRDYCLFVMFFPQLIAGPIVHYREMMPQFHAASCRFDAVDASVAVSLFVFGLFKKVVLADGVAPAVSGLYAIAGGGSHVTLIPAWLAAVGFTLQIYFDFSGYTDMALGLGRFFGIRLPPNFDSPLKAPSIIDFWLHWHMTLTRFLTAYVFNPLALALTRRRMALGLPGLGGRTTNWGAFLSLLVFPTLVTMTVSGIWHGAGYLFLAWGVLHGVYLSVNHAWRRIRLRGASTVPGLPRHAGPIGVAITFMAVATSMVLFRSTDFHMAGNILSGMTGLHGVDGIGASRTTAASITALLGIALFCPNTLQIMARFEPALGRPTTEDGDGGRITWRPSVAWAAALAVLAVVSMLSLGGPSEFLYWQF